MPTSLEQTVLEAFARAFGTAPVFLAQAPARVELLGNHTDYNGGLVMAAAIDRFTMVAGRAVPGCSARVFSAHFAQAEQFDTSATDRGEAGSWGRYVRGVVWALREACWPLPSGFEAAIAGNVPLGAGLSSSASLQAAVALFLWQAATTGTAALDDAARLALAQVLRRSENDFVGVASGLLDQFSVLFGRADHALRLDCRSLEFARLPLGRPGPAIVVCDSKTARRLAEGMYNQRRDECERVVAYFQERRGPEAVRWLRDLTLDDLRSAWDDLDAVGRLRARHVLTENERVRKGAERLQAGDLAGFGRLMSASHASSRDDFGNSAPALDALIDAAEAAPGFLGGKLSGAGWAGCTVNLVQADQAEAFAAEVADGYARRTGISPTIHICHASAGAEVRSV